MRAAGWGGGGLHCQYVVGGFGRGPGGAASPGGAERG